MIQPREKFGQLGEEADMKIIQITDHNGNGGVNSFVYDLCAAQIKLGNEVLFISIIDCKEHTTKPELQRIEKLGVQVKCIGAKSKVNAIFRHIIHLRKVIKDFSDGKPCICNLHLKLSVLMGVTASLGLKNIKIVETYHNNYDFYHLQYTVLHPWIKQYIAISHTCAKEMKKRFHTSDHLMSVIPNGIDREGIRRIALTDPLKKHTGIRFVTVGRLSYEKNITVPVKAFSDFCKEGLEYWVVGDGPEREKVHSLAANNPYIKFEGELQRKEALRNLETADMVIMPSLWEGRSILQLEAMALDKPLMLSDVPALREVFGEPALADDELYRKCAWGYLVQTNNTESYRMAAENFSRLAIAEKCAMSHRVRLASLENGITEMAQKYQMVYEAIIAEND